jgi:hypothetical protein
MSEDKRGTTNLLDHLGHGVGFAGAGYAQQHLVLLAASDPFHQSVDGLLLVALGAVIADEFEGRRHGRFPTGWSNHQL